MKLTVFLLFAGIFTVSANTHALSQRVSLNVENTELSDVFRSLREQTGYMITYSESKVASERTKVTIHLDDVELREALDALLRNLPYTYSITDQRVFIIPAPGKLDQQPQQPRTIKGRVTDENGVPLAGAVIILKSAPRGGSVSGADGRYSIPYDPKYTILVVSYVGYKKKEEVIGDRTTIDIRLEPDVTSIEEVVITGYQTIERRKLSSSISSIQAKDLDHFGALTVDQMLDGKLPGLMVTSSSATPGAASKMRLRGSNTFTGSREPLWVIDNIIYEDPVPLSPEEINSWDNINIIGNAISGLNPNDIERIDILKDASATAIYGTRAANGVIVVTTKQGREGETAVSYSGSTTISRAPRNSDFEMMNSQERIDVSREIINRGLWYTSTPGRVGYEGAMMDYWDKKITFEQFEDRVHAMETTNADWFDALYRTAVSQSHNVSLSGGASRTRYYFSVGYTDENSTEKSVGLTRVTGRSKINTRLGKKITAEVNMSGSIQNGNYINPAFSSFNSAYYTSRTIPVTNPDGSYYYIPKLITGDVFGNYNILNEIDRSGRKIANKSFNLTGSINWEIAKGLRYVGTGSYTSTTNLEENWINDKTFYIDNMRLALSPLVPEKGGLYKSGFMDQQSWTLRNQFNYTHTWNDIHTLNMDVGQESRSTRYKGNAGGYFPGYLYDHGETFAFLPAQTENKNTYYTAVNEWFTSKHQAYPRITNSERNNLSFYGIFTYSFKNIYSLNLNVRNDGSNQFGQYNQSRFNPTWSVSGRVNLTDLGILGGRESGNTFAFRTSYGYRGNVPNASPYLIIGYPQYNTTIGDDIAYMVSFPNGDLDWERTSTYNAAVDFSFLNNRISGALDGYYSHSTDLLTTRRVSLVNGKGSELVNSGSSRNYGVELSLSTVNIVTDNLRWRTSLNISMNRNKILRGEQDKFSNDYNNYLSGGVIRQGESIDGFYAYRFAGLDERGLPRFDNLTGLPQNLTKDEFYDIMFEYQGTRSPLWYGGFSTELSWKNLHFRANFAYKLGHKVRLLKLYNGNASMPMPETNMHAAFTGRWRQQGDEYNTNIPALSNEYLNIPGQTTVVTPDNEWRYTMVDKPYLSYAGPTSNSGWYMYDYSNARVVNADFIRWRDAAIGYTLPSKWIKALRIANARIDFQIQNICVIVFDKNLKGQDPEQVERVGMPALPAYTINLSLGF